MKKFLLLTLSLFCLMNNMRAMDASSNCSRSAQADLQQQVSNITLLPPEMQLHAITWMLDVDTPENLLNSLIMICDSALIDTNLNALTTDQNLGYCLRVRLHNTGQSLTTLLNANYETVLHLLTRRQHVSARFFNVIQIAAGNQFNNLVSMQDNAQRTAVHNAAWNGHTACVHAILNTPGVNAQQLVFMQDIHQNTAVYCAARNGHTACVQALVNAPGVNAQLLVSIQNIHQNTTVHYAAWNGHTACVHALLNAAGVNAHNVISMRNNQQVTALDIAQQRGHQDIVALLQPYMNHNNQ